MGRKLKYHEQVLLKKHNFLFSKKNTNLRELHVLRRYQIENRQDYIQYNRLVGRITQLCTKLKSLPQDSKVRILLTQKLLEKLYSKGIIPTMKSLEVASLVT